MLRPVLFATFAALSLTGCTLAGAAQETPSAQPAKDAQAEGKRIMAEQCAAQGGTVYPVGLLNEERCVIPYKDAGKDCTDDDQCEGQCWASGVEPKADGKIHGQCQPTNMPFGCNANVVDGKALPVLCVD